MGAFIQKNLVTVDHNANPKSRWRKRIMEVPNVSVPGEHLGLLVGTTRGDLNQYSGYSVEIRETNMAVSVGVMNGRVFRWIYDLRRDPAARKFVVLIRRGVTPGERRLASSHAENLPRGEWARFPGWRRLMLTNGRWSFVQRRGVAADDPCIQLELEMLIDSSCEIGCLA
jgi:hypothetical protein